MHQTKIEFEFTRLTCVNNYVCIQISKRRNIPKDIVTILITRQYEIKKSG